MIMQGDPGADDATGAAACMQIELGSAALRRPPYKHSFIVLLRKLGPGEYRMISSGNITPPSTPTELLCSPVGPFAPRTPPGPPPGTRPIGPFAPRTPPGPPPKTPPTTRRGRKRNFMMCCTQDSDESSSDS